MSYLPAYKTSNCSFCDNKDCPCHKVKRDYYCLAKCYPAMKGREQLEKVKKRQALERDKSKIRTLINTPLNKEVGSRAALIEDLDFVVSRIVRLKGADKNGTQTCYCCGFKTNWQNLHNGHYISRSHLGLRFDTKWNCKPCCFQCNITEHGNLEKYKENLDKEMPGISDYLYEQSKDVAQIGNDELKQLLVALREELKLIEKFNKNKN